MCVTLYQSTFTQFIPVASVKQGTGVKCVHWHAAAILTIPPQAIGLNMVSLLSGITQMKTRLFFVTTSVSTNTSVYPLVVCYKYMIDDASSCGPDRGSASKYSRSDGEQEEYDDQQNDEKKEQNRRINCLPGACQVFKI